MPRHILHVCYACVASRPFQIAEIASVAYGAAYARVVVEHRHHHRVVVGHQIHHSHHSIAASHSHIHLHTVLASAVDGHKIVCTVDGIAHHLGGYKFISAQKFQFSSLDDCGVPRYVGIQPPQLVHLTLEIEITSCEVLIHLGQREKRLDGGVHLIDLAHKSI